MTHRASPETSPSFFQMGTSSFRRSIPCRHASKASARCGAEHATTTEASVRYRGGVRFDDELRIHVRATDVRGARFRFEYVVERISDPQGVVADGWTGHACVSADTLRPTRMPTWLAEAIAGVEG